MLQREWQSSPSQQLHYWVWALSWQISETWSCWCHDVMIWSHRSLTWSGARRAARSRRCQGAPPHRIVNPARRPPQCQAPRIHWTWAPCIVSEQLWVWAMAWMSPDGRDTSGRPGKDHSKMYEGETGQEAVKVQRKCHHSHWAILSLLMWLRHWDNVGHTTSATARLRPRRMEILMNYRSLSYKILPSITWLKFIGI